MNTTYFSLSGWLLLLTAPIAAVIVYRFTASHRHTVFPYSTILALVFLSCMCLWIPYHSGEPFSPLGNLVESGRKSFRLFTMAEPVEAFLRSVSQNMVFRRDVDRQIYQSLGVFLFAVCPLLTIGFFLSCIRSISARFRFLLQRKRDKYIFSELNDASLTLAASIRSRFPKALLAFTSVKESEQTSAHALSQKASALNAVLVKEGITQINWRRYRGRGITHLFTISDQNTNLYQASDLVAQYRKETSFRLYVFARGVESEALFNTSTADGIRIRRVDPVRSAINQSLYEKGHEIFEEAVQVSGEHKLISIVIVGLGRCGTELLKSLTWLCQMNGYRLQIHAFDKDPMAESKFRLLCPELMSPLHNGTFIPGDAQYEITIHSGVDVHTSEFYEQLQQIGLITRVYVMLGDDTRNINTAIDLRSELTRFAALDNSEKAAFTDPAPKGYYSVPIPTPATAPPPTILAEVESTQKKDSLQDMRDYHNNRYNIRFIGDNRSVYTCDIVLGSQLEEDALARHKRWADHPDAEQSFWASEMNYQSSIAAAIHARMRILCRIPGADKPEQDLTFSEREVIEELEHRRWNAYMRSCGFCYSRSPKRTSRNHLAKLHNNLVPYGELHESVKRNDSRIALEESQP